MTRAAALSAIAGLDDRFVSGIAWLPAETLEVLAYGTAAVGPADSLAALAHALELDFAFVPALEPWAPEAVAGLHDADVASVWAVAGVLGRAGERAGWSEMLRMTVAEPGALAVYIAEALHDALGDVRAGIAARADIILIADDLAGATGRLVSPDFALDALMPCYRSLANEVRISSLPAVFHSDGDIRTLLPALGRAGFSAVHLAGLAEQPFAASFGAARAVGLTVLGGIEAAALMSGARRLGTHAAEVARSGGLLICDDGGITSAEEVAAFASALEAARAAHTASADEGAEPADADAPES